VCFRLSPLIQFRRSCLKILMFLEKSLKFCIGVQVLWHIGDYKLNLYGSSTLFLGLDGPFVLGARCLPSGIFQCNGSFTYSGFLTYLLIVSIGWLHMTESITKLISSTQQGKEDFLFISGTKVIHFSVIGTSVILAPMFCWPCPNKLASVHRCAVLPRTVRVHQMVLCAQVAGKSS
jgi:hypothetical protein